MGTEEEASREVHKGETSLMLGPSLEKNSHVFIVGNLAILEGLLTP